MCILLVYWRNDLCKNAQNGQLQRVNLLRIYVASHISLWTDTTRQCTYTVTMKCARVAIVAVEKRWLLHVLSVCLCSCLAYPAYKSNAHFIAIRGLSHSTTLPHIITHSAPFSKEKKSAHLKCVLIFPNTFVWNISHCKKQNRNMQCKLELIIRTAWWKVNCAILFCF